MVPYSLKCTAVLIFYILTLWALSVAICLSIPVLVASAISPAVKGFIDQHRPSWKQLLSFFVNHHVRFVYFLEGVEFDSESYMDYILNLDFLPKGIVKDQLREEEEKVKQLETENNQLRVWLEQMQGYTDY